MWWLVPYALLGLIVVGIGAGLLILLHLDKGQAWVKPAILGLSATLAACGVAFLALGHRFDWSPRLIGAIVLLDWLLAGFGGLCIWASDAASIAAKRHLE